MSDARIPSTVGATYVEPSATEILQPGLELGDLLRRNMTQPFVLQRLAERVWWVRSSSYGTVFHVGDDGVLILDALERIYDNITQAVASVTDKPIFFDTVSQEATEALRPKYGQLYGFDHAPRGNAAMVAWTLFEYR